jgi:hypothetical protein
MENNFDTSFETFVAGCQVICDVYHKASGFHAGQRKVITVDPNGRRYKRVVCTDANGSGRSVHVFVDTTNGNVLKSASWATPAKHARGNIYDANNGLACMGPYGAAYLR